MKRRAKQKANNQKYILILGFLLLFIGLGYMMSGIDLPTLPTGLAIYGAGTEVQLNIWLNSSNPDQLHTGEQIYFFANFTNITDNSPLNLSVHEDMNCTFMENSTGSWSAPINMTFDPESNLSFFNISFPSRGTFAYNITCFGNESYSFENISLRESFAITNCNPPASGDWIINESANIVCENVNVEINGSINATDYSNLTLINSTFTDTVIADVTVRNGSSFKIQNSSLVLFSELLLSNSSLEMINSSIEAPSMNITDARLNLTNSSMNAIINSINSQLTFQNSSLDSSGPVNVQSFNSSIFMFGSKSPNQIVLTNSTNLIAIQSNFTPSLYISEEINLENISDNTYNTVYLSSPNFKINLSNTFITATTIVSYDPLNLSNSRINRLIPSNDVRILNSNITQIPCAALLEKAYNIIDSTIGDLYLCSVNLTANNLTVTGQTDNFNSTQIFHNSRINLINSISEANTTLSGNISITQKMIYLFGENASITRFFPIYIYNGSSQLNGSINITYGDSVLWAGNLTDSYVLINLTFNATTYTEKYNINTPIGYVGKISLLDDTPINKSAVISKIALNTILLTANGTLFNDTAYINITSNKPLACMYSDSTGNYTANKTAGNAKIFNGTYLRYNDTIGKAHGLFNSSELPFIFAGGVFHETSGTNDNDVVYAEELYLGTGADSGRIVFTGDAGTPDNDEDASSLVYFGNSMAGVVYTYLLKFNGSIAYNNFSSETAREDLVGSSIYLQGTKYFITDLNAAGSGNSIVEFDLMSGGNNTWLANGTTTLMNVSGIVHAINITGVTTALDSCGVSIDGDVSWIDKGALETINSVKIGVLSSKNESGTEMCRLLIGTTILKLRNDAGKMQKNGADIDNAYGYMTGTAGNWTGLNITYYPNNKIYLNLGESFIDPVFNQSKISFVNITRGNTENISFVSSGLAANFTFTNNNNTQIIIPYYLNSSGVPVRGYNSTRPLLVVGEQYNVSIEGQQAGMMFFFVTNASRASILRLDGIDTTNHELNLSDLTYGENYTELAYTNSPDTLNQFTIASASNITLNISADQKTIYYQDAPSAAAKTKYGAHITFNQSQIIFNENNNSGNNASIALAPGYDFVKGITITYDAAYVLNRANKISGSNTIKIANTRYGTLIENDEQNQNSTIISHPQNQTVFDVRVMGVSGIIGSSEIQSAYTASSNYGMNNLSLTCTDGEENITFESTVNVSISPVLSSKDIEVTTSRATINITANLPVTSIFSYGDTDNNTMPFATSISSFSTQQDYALTSLSSGTTFYYNITLCNMYGRCITNGAYSFTTLSPTTTPALERWNYVDAASIINAEPFANRRFSDIKQGEPYSADISYIQVAVSKIEFIPKKDIKDITFTFAKIKNLTDVPVLSDTSKVHSYLRFNITQASFDDLSDVKVTFRIDKGWFDTNNFSKEAMALNRYSGQWAELDTEYAKEDDFYHYYTAKVPGFSVFAITATKGNLPREAAPIEESNPAQSNTTALPTTPVQIPDDDLQDLNTRQANNNQDSHNPPQEESPQQITIQDKLAALTKNSMFVPAAIGLLALLLVGGGVAVARRPKSMVQELARKQMTNQEVISELKAKGVYGQSLEELRQFISASMHQGRNSNEIKAALLSVGWEEHIIDDVFQLFNVH